MFDQASITLIQTILDNNRLSSLVTALSIRKACWFLLGQLDRTDGKGMRMTAGSYLDGWHHPSKVTPPSLSKSDWVIISDLPEFATLLASSR